MDLMHEVFGDGMMSMYVIAILVGIAGGAIARLSGVGQRRSASGSKQ
jgi:uncharacterized membrane protein YuzA (DUF378 family)